MVSTDWVTSDSGLSKAQFVTEYAVIMTASDDILTSTEIMEKTINVITALNLPERKKSKKLLIYYLRYVGRDHDSDRGEKNSLKIRVDL